MEEYKCKYCGTIQYSAGINENSISNACIKCAKEGLEEIIKKLPHSLPEKHHEKIKKVHYFR